MPPHLSLSASLPSSLHIVSTQSTTKAYSSFKSNKTSSILLPQISRMPPIPLAFTSSPLILKKSSSNVTQETEVVAPISSQPSQYHKYLFLPTPAAFKALPVKTTTTIKSSLLVTTTASLKSQNIITRSSSSSGSRENSGNSNTNNSIISSRSSFSIAGGSDDDGRDSSNLISNETKLDIQPNFLIKQPVPNISSSYFRSSSLNSHSVKHNDSDTDFFVSDKTKNYSKLIYQDINIESLDDDFGDDDDDNQNHVDNDSDNKSDSGNSAGGNISNNVDSVDNIGNTINYRMYFGTTNYTNVSTQIGLNVDVPCTVHNIGEGVVSFIIFIYSHFHFIFISVSEIGVWHDWKRKKNTIFHDFHFNKILMKILSKYLL